MKQWSRFFIKCLVFVGIVFLFDKGIGHLFIYAKDKGLERHPQDMWLNTSYTIEKVDAQCVVIGSSTAEHNYIPEKFEKELGLSTYNCGQGGCFFLYGCCLINSIVDRYCPEIIIFDLSPKNMLDTDKRDEYQNMRYLSYYYDKDSNVRRYIQGKSKNIKWFYNLQCYRYNSHFIYTFYPLLHNSPTQSGYIPAPPTSVGPSKLPQEWKGEWEEMELAELIHTIEHCKARGVELIFVTSPLFAENDNSVFVKSSDFTQILLNNDVKYINLLTAEPFDADSSLFRDAAHLNTRGAELFTDMVVKSIKSFR